MSKKFAVMTGAMLLALLVAAVGCPPPATAPADFYKGKTVDLTITSSPGNLNDLSARIVANYLSEDTRANVTVTTRKGASGLEGINYVYKAKPDGLNLGAVTSAKFIANKILDEPAAEYEIDELSYIMSIDFQPYYFLVSPEGPYQSVADLQAGQDLKIGGSTPSGPSALGSLTAIRLLGLDAKVITGIRSESERALAVSRGEIIGYCMPMPSARASLEAGMVKPLFVLTAQRDPLHPEVPAITELVDCSDEDLDLVELWSTAFMTSNIFFAPAGLPEDRLAYLRSLADQWVQDEAFRADINQVANYEVQTYRTGEEVTQTIMDTVAGIDEFRAIFTELIEKYRA